MKQNGAIIYTGPSMLDGQPIIAVVTGLSRKSANPKTGNMLQTWIIRSDLNPVAALQSGADVSICGDCPQRPYLGGACYLNVPFAPNSVFKAYQRGIYPTLPALGLGIGRAVRIGSYGDPAAVPAAVWRDLLSGSASHTGYTHQWLRNSEVTEFCMASVDNETEHDMAQSLGLRTFRVRHANEPTLPRESVCPASAEAGHKLTCQTCGACNGGSERKGSIVIVIHGAKAANLTRAA